MSGAAGGHGGAAAHGAEVPVPANCESLLVFGGAFDPPHRAHVELPPKARDAIGADWALYVPTARTPLKEREAGASAEDRMEMVRLALEGTARASVSDVEIRRGGTSYTVDTLRELRAALPRMKRMRLLIGADQAAQFHRWREPGEIVRLAEPLVLLRAPEETRSALRKALQPNWGEDDLELWRRRIIELPTIEAASTDVRAALAREGADAPSLRGVVPEAVLGYIRARRLYGV